MSHLITAEYFQEQMATLGLKASFAPSAYNLDTLIVEASDWVEGYCDRKFELQTVTEARYGPVRHGSKFVADNFPVVSVSSAYADDEPIDTSNFRVNNAAGVIEWRTGTFSPDVFYTITYSTGFASVPSNVQRATALKIAMLLQPQYQGPQEREIFMATNIEVMVVDALEKYRRERLG